VRGVEVEQIHYYHVFIYFCANGMYGGGLSASRVLSARHGMSRILLFVGYGEMVQYVHFRSRSPVLISELQDTVGKCVEDIPTRGLGFRSRPGCMEDNTGTAGAVHFEWVDSELQRFQKAVRTTFAWRRNSQSCEASLTLHHSRCARCAFSKKSLCLPSRLNLHVMLTDGSINTHTCPPLRVDGQNGLETRRPFPQPWWVRF
jgi:hypothetical protein